jgi:hypothetical protein
MLSFYLYLMHEFNMPKWDLVQLYASIREKRIFRQKMKSMLSPRISHPFEFCSIIKNLVRYCSIIVIIFLDYSCKKEPDYIRPPYAEIERTTRDLYDHFAVFTWNQYVELLDKLSELKFIVLPLNEMRNTFDDSKVIVGLRHDVDFNPFKALEMAKFEKDYGIRATYFLLATSKYHGHISNSTIVHSTGIEYLFKEIHDTGAEIGIHNDLLTIMIVHNIDPFKFNQEEILFYSSLNIQVFGTAAHGSHVAQITVPNYQIFSDFSKNNSVEYQGKKYPLGEHSLNEYGFNYEAYFINFNLYFSDSGGRWNDPEGFSGILKKLESSKPGDRIQILAHPDHWGRTSN